MKILILLTILIALSTSTTLIIADNENFANTHSQFFQQLASRDNLEYAYPFKTDSKIELKAYDKFKYENIIVMCTSAKRSTGKIKVEEIIDYFDNGGNAMIIGDIDTSLYYRKLFYGFGVELEETGTLVKDHFNNHHNSALIKTENYEAIEPFVSHNFNKQPLLYRGIGMNLATYENYQLYELARSQYTAFSRDMFLNKTVKAGTAITLLAAVQGLNNARAILSGSLDFFSNEIFDAAGYSNKDYVANLIDWTFKRTGVLKVESMTYHGQKATEKETIYNVGEKIYFKATVNQFDYIEQQWTPYVTNDLQVQFVMLDPWVRQSLSFNNSSSTYDADFYAPTKQGIYQFKIIYKKPGYTFLKQSEKVTVRPYKHDEFERFLFVASPYYLGVFATIFGTFIFVLSYLYSASAKQKEE